MTGHLTKLAERPFCKRTGQGIAGRQNNAVCAQSERHADGSSGRPATACFSRREDPRDVLVLPEGAASLDPLKPLGCSSLRRTLQLQQFIRI